MQRRAPGDEDIDLRRYTSPKRAKKGYKPCVMCGRQCAHMAFGGIALNLCSGACVEGYKHKFSVPRLTFFVPQKDIKEPEFAQPITEHGLKLYYNASDGWCVKGSGVKGYALGKDIKSHTPYKIFTTEGYYEVIIIITGTTTCLHGSNSRRNT